jgi:hypothetical protein
VKLFDWIQTFIGRLSGKWLMFSYCVVPSAPSQVSIRIDLRLSRTGCGSGDLHIAYLHDLPSGQCVSKAYNSTYPVPSHMRARCRCGPSTSQPHEKITLLHNGEDKWTWTHSYLTIETHRDVTALRIDSKDTSI